VTHWTPPPARPRGAIRADLAHAEMVRRRAILRGLMVAVIGGALAALLIALWVWRIAFAELPPIPGREALWSMNRPPGITFLDRTGAVIGQRGFRHGAPVGLTQLPDYVPKAFLAAEDRRFYHHPGVDLRGVVRAARADLAAHRVVQGGSTITQQVARGIFLNSDQTLTRKLQEAALALRIETMMDKDEILALYLNRTYFGGGAYGLEAASRVWFAKPASRLSLAEAALLASLPKAPTRLDPANNLHAAVRRSRLVLDHMLAEKWISDDQRRDALAHPPQLAAEPMGEGDLGYVFDTAAAEARSLANGAAPDLVVRLTIDPRLQHEATRAVREGVAAVRNRGATEGALVALGPEGDMLAVVGGLDHRDSAFNRATQARRQPGSAFKPIVYAAAFAAGLIPEDVRPDAPLKVGDYAPENSDGSYRGNISLTEAVARSVNTVAVRVAQEVGPGRIGILARQFGISGIPPDPALPIALGAYEVNLAELTGAYQVFQSGGRQARPFLVREVANARGDVLWRHSTALPPVIYDNGHAGQMVRVLRQVIDSPYGTGRRARLDRPAAGKTGTSQNNRDAWFVGFTPDLVCGVWVGDDHGQPMQGITGGETPALIWRDFMLVAHRGLAPRNFSEAGGSDPRDSFFRSLARDFEAAQRPELGLPAAPDRAAPPSGDE
jgi:penicillin-binding protein 1A